MFRWRECVATRHEQAAIRLAGEINMALETISFGTCPCGLGRFETRRVEINMTLPGGPLVLTNMLQGNCPHCGSRVYSAEDLMRIECLFQGNRPATEREVPEVQP